MQFEALAFSTNKLSCKILNPQHQTDYCGLYTSQSVMKYIGTPLSYCQANTAFERTIRQIKRNPRQNCVWAIHLTSNNQFCGIVGFSKSRNSAGIYCGIMLNEQARFKGINLAACLGMLTISFTHLSLSQLHAIHSKDNTVVGRLLCKLGFQPSAGKEASIPKQSALYTLTNEHFEQIKQTRYYAKQSIK